MKTITLISLSSIILFSCAPNVPTNSNDLTLGAVQSKIYKGQSQSEVMDVLGSPNIVTKDTQGREVWTYDRISSDKNSESCLLYTSPSPRDRQKSRMPSSA